jgi:adenylate cyclase
VKERVEGRFAFRSIDEIKPKGFAEDVRIFELCRETDGDSEHAFFQRWEIVYAVIRKDATAAALVRVTDFLAQYPGDGVARYHAEALRTVLRASRLVTGGAMQ